MLILRAEIEGSAPVDVRIADGRIAEIGHALPRHRSEPVLDAAGAALLPGLHDHHLHLFALAAAQMSLRCGPPAVRNPAGLERALRQAAGHDWIRGIAYHESVAGEIDRRAIDAWVSDRPVRIQHRSGALWIVNSAAALRLGLDAGADLPGIERDASGRTTGRLFRLDTWLRERLAGSAPSEPPDLSHVGRQLATYGVTGVTDATPSNGPRELRALENAVDKGRLRQRLLVMGGDDLPETHHPSVVRGARKVMLTEHDLPSAEQLEGIVAAAHRASRAVAIHCVTRTELVFAAAAFAARGTHPGDRIEHAAVAPPEVVELLAGLGLTVVTQPGFVRERGDAYRVDVEPRDRPWLHRGAGFPEAGVALGAGTDAPFGHPDPWLAMRAAVERRTEAGSVLGAGERLSSERALALFTSPEHAPGDEPRRVAIGAPADLCLLDRPWDAARSELSSAHVAATLRAGSLTFLRD